MKNKDKNLRTLSEDLLGSTVDVTATTGGAAIPASADVVNCIGITGQTGYKIVLPTPVVGKKLTLINASGFAFALVSSTPASIGINGGTGTVSLAIATAKVCECTCVSLTNWVVEVNNYTAAS